MSHEKAIAAALEPILDDLIALEKRVEALQLIPGPKGEPGRDADQGEIAIALAANEMFIARTAGLPGEDGIDGAGIDAPPYVAGEVYRKGTIVVAHIGQHFVALKDTVAAPGDSDQWRRIGAGGFRHRGNFDKDATYRDGDLYIKDFGTFGIVNGAHVLIAGRGTKGERGDPGERGQMGLKGRDGATIIGAQVQGFKLVLVQQDADGAIDHLEADFEPAYREVVREAIAQAVPDLMSTVAELHAEIDMLKRQARRLHA